MQTIPLRDNRTVPLTGVLKPFPSATTFSAGAIDAFNYRQGLTPINLSQGTGSLPNTTDFWLTYFNNDGYTYIGSFDNAFEFASNPGNAFAFWNGSFCLAQLAMNNGPGLDCLLESIVFNQALNDGEVSPLGVWSRTFPTTHANNYNAVYVAHPNIVDLDGDISAFCIYEEMSGLIEQSNTAFSVSYDGATVTPKNAWRIPWTDYHNLVSFIGTVIIGSTMRAFAVLTKPDDITKVMVAIDFTPDVFDPDNVVDAVVTEIELDDPTLNNLILSGSDLFQCSYKNNDCVILTNYSDGLGTLPYMVMIASDLSCYDVVGFDAQNADAQTVIDKFTGAVPSGQYSGKAYIGDDLFFACGDDTEFIYATSALTFGETFAFPTSGMCVSDIYKLPCFHPCVPHMKKGLKINV